MRLTSLDVFRGITIAGMILVNTASIAEPNVYPPLLHAEWHGCTPTDLVFPFFLFIVGVAMSFSFSKYTDSKLHGEKEKVFVSLPYWRIIRRAAILFVLGLLLNGFWNQGVWTFDFNSIRVMGVLQRISLTYLLASLVVFNIPRKGQWILAGVLLIVYWLAMMYVPVSGYGAGVLTRDGNLGAYIDRLIIPKAHLYKGDNYNFMGDPEGLFSTIPAIVSVLAGYFAGQWIRSQKQINSKTSMDLVLFGLSCLVIGGIWDLAFPINKKLWTSSYVVFTTGWALLLLAFCYELIDVRRVRRWGKPFEIMGYNPIFLFTASVLLIKILVKTTVGTGETAPSTYNWIYQNLFVSWAGAYNGSLFLAIATVLLWLVVAYAMYRRRWLIKV
ncbi:acyltransferase family protein [Fischerella thermalis]|uniref:acyltransferase family protein n=1 Tax=Fischerella thermalis TaxID=372787 RepID=UPI0019E09500|nr:acyltransferase family protein [Fischerella thermalis]MBF1989969.1 acyltransferase family protein [Fischerella thermalis M58_A2018_009]MBF2062665.1 acyltransferase family protein [Fischerella thermalis M66_A2018_004]MBF2068428.1 acyltransferase family protein [Fischerella thermalis M48_A2018_028]